MLKIDEKILNEAYEKFKAYIYYSKVLTFNYSKIIDFEKNLGARLKNLEEALNGTDELWDSYKNKNLKTIKWKALPKDISKSDRVITFNKEDETLKLDDFNNVELLFEANIEVNIISILWIIYVGKFIDESFSKSSYGGRILREKKNRGDDYRLFEFSYEDYGQWKDKALEQQEIIHQRGEDSIIINMDLLRFHYAIDFSRDIFLKAVENGNSEYNSERIVKRLNEFLLESIDEYSDKVIDRFKFNAMKKENPTILPIGFLPSFILSNYYFDDLDRRIISEVDPVYYGRYNNEIIIVDRVKRKFYHESYRDIRAEDFISLYLGKGIISVELGRQDRGRGERSSLDKADIYLTVRDRKLMIKKDKFTVVNIKAAQSNEPIRVLRENIRESFCGIKIAAGDLEVFTGNCNKFFSSINERIIEIRDLGRGSIDRHRIERLIERQVILSKLIERRDKSGSYSEKRKLVAVENILTDEFIINCYGSWENIINCYIIGKRIDFLYEFLDLINKAIERIDISNLNLSKIDKIRLESNLRESLRNHLTEVLSRTLALIYGREKVEIIEKIEEKIKRKRLTERIDYITKYNLINRDNSILDTGCFVRDKKNLLKEYKGELAVLSNLKDSFLILKELEK